MDQPHLKLSGSQRLVAPGLAGACGCALGAQSLSSVWRGRGRRRQEAPRRPGQPAQGRSGGAAVAGTGSGMTLSWRALLRTAQRYPWPTNVLLYATLYSAGDALQQRLQGGPADWQQTRRVATLAVAFHANFNYVWLHLLERALPGRAPRAVLAKVVCDQALGGPVALSAFYAGEGPGWSRGPGSWIGGLEAGAGSWSGEGGKGIEDRELEVEMPRAEKPGERG